MDRDEVIHQIVIATTLPAIADARQLWQGWIGLHPDDKYATDLFYLLDCAEEVACKRTAEWDALRIKLKTQGAARLTVDEAAHIGLSASSLEEISHARQVLHEWEQAHPDEQIKHEVYEMLYVKENGRLTEAAEQNAIAA